jgi:hypothetical protein
MCEPLPAPDVCPFAHKVRHPSRRLAVEAMRTQLRTILHQRGRDRPTMAVYPCGACRGWHVGRNDVQLLRHERRAARRKPEPTVEDFEGE